jgi:plastocyanin
LGLTALVAALSITATLLARTSLTAEARASASPMAIRAFAYGPTSVRVAAGETVRLAVRNDDTALHTFTLAEAAVDVSIPPGAERLVEFTAPAAGTYTWFCVPHSSATGTGREGMVGRLVVAP